MHVGLRPRGNFQCLRSVKFGGMPGFIPTLTRASYCRSPLPLDTWLALREIEDDFDAREFADDVDMGVLTFVERLHCRCFAPRLLVRLTLQIR